jgi:hypothetical protein
MYCKMPTRDQLAGKTKQGEKSTYSEDLTKLDVQNNTLYCLILCIHYTSLFFQSNCRGRFRGGPTAPLLKGNNINFYKLYLHTVFSQDEVFRPTLSLIPGSAPELGYIFRDVNEKSPLKNLLIVRLKQV